MLQKYGRRFAYYGFGLLLGIVSVRFITRQKGADFSYGPEARVLKNLKLKTMILNPEMDCYFEKSNFSEKAFKELWEKSDLDVSFSESEAQREPFKRYQLYGEYRDKTYAFYVENQDSTLHVLRFMEEGKNIVCP